MLTELRARIITATVDPLAAATYNLATVPADEYWRLRTVHVVGSAGTITFSRLKVIDPIAQYNLTIKAPTAASDQLYDLMSGPLDLPAGWILAVLIAAYNAGDTLTAYAVYRRWFKEKS